MSTVYPFQGSKIKKELQLIPLLVHSVKEREYIFYLFDRELRSCDVNLVAFLEGCVTRGIIIISSSSSSWDPIPHLFLQSSVVLCVFVKEKETSCVLHDEDDQIRVNTLIYSLLLPLQRLKTKEKSCKKLLKENEIEKQAAEYDGHHLLSSHSF